MRKVVSAPQLSALVKDTRQPDLKKDASARGIPKNMSCSFVGGSLRRPQGGLNRQSSHDSQHSQGRSSISTRPAFLLDMPLATALPAQTEAAELEQELLEASMARGLAATECFELYGDQQAAPDLRGDVTGDAAAQGWDKRGALAACLATPITGTDKNLGEIVDESVRRMFVTTQANTEARYAQEVKAVPGGMSTQDEDDGPLSHGQARPRRKRRNSREDDWEDGGWRVSRGSYSSARAASPETHELLTPIYASLDDDGNKLQLDEAYVCRGDFCYADPDPFPEPNLFLSDRAHSVPPLSSSAAPASFRV